MSGHSTPSGTPGPSSKPAPVETASGNRHNLTPAEVQAKQLARLLKDPAKPAYVPDAPKEKSVRPPREMIKNVQGSSAGAGSGEFHVYKANRRREYERLKIMEEQVERVRSGFAFIHESVWLVTARSFRTCYCVQETAAQEFERKKREREEAADAKTAKNRAKRQKKKVGRTKGKDSTQPATTGNASGGGSGGVDDGLPVKKRRLVSGHQVVFRAGDDDGDEDSADDGEDGPQPASGPAGSTDVLSAEPVVPLAQTSTIRILDED